MRNLMPISYHTVGFNNSISSTYYQKRYIKSSFHRNSVHKIFVFLFLFGDAWQQKRFGTAGVNFTNILFAFAWLSVKFTYCTSIVSFLDGHPIWVGSFKLSKEFNLPSSFVSLDGFSHSHIFLFRKLLHGNFELSFWNV